MRIDREPAWLIHNRHWRESSLIVEMFTRRHGRMGLIARGARRPKSRWRGLFVPFQPLLVSWTGRGELPVVTGLDAPERAVPLHGEQLLACLYLNELLLRLTPRADPQTDLFDAYARTVAGFDAPHPPIAALLRRFEQTLLQALGYGMSLREDNQGCAIEPEASYLVTEADGTVRVASGADQGAGAIRGRHLLAMANDHYDDAATRTAALRVHRHAIDTLLGNRPLKSRELLTALRQS